jgi:transcriptional regulator with XRE-family HTH domain
MDIRAVFGRNLKHYRQRAGLSQAALAAKLDIDRAHISSMERAKQNVTIHTLWLLSLVLEIDPALLLEYRDPAEK